MNRAFAVAGLVLTAVALSACTDREDTLAPRPMGAEMLPYGKTTSLVVEADLPVARLVLTIDDGMGRRPIELRREEKEGLLVGALDVAPGVKARVAFSAYDAEGQLTHQGKGTLVTDREVTPQQEFVLAPVPGAEDASVRIGTYRLALSQTAIVSVPGKEMQIEAMLLDARGEPHPIEKGGLEWMDAKSQQEIGNVRFDPRDYLIDILWIPEKWFVGRLEFCTFDVRVCGKLTLTDPNPIIQVATGAWHGCALRQSGTVRCWGDNSLRQLGKSAAGVSALSNVVFKSISATSFHTCGVDDAGNARCWGSPGHGQLGVSSSVGVEYPNIVAGLPDQVREVTAGGSHSCALLVNDETWCWGANYYGQLGDSTATNTTPVNGSVTPVKVSGAHAFRTISAGLEHTCGITGPGVAWCWGSNTDGQSGFSNATADKCQFQSTYYPSTWVNCAATPRQVQTGVSFAGVGGGSLSTCAWTSGGTGYCWGRAHGSFVSAGYGMNHVPRTPTSQPSWKFLTAATEFQCGIDSGDMVQCFGDTQHGQTGTGISLPTYTVHTPTPVTVPDAWTSVDGGSQFACGVRALGFVVSCWGRNEHGQLGRVTPAGFSATPGTASF